MESWVVIAVGAVTQLFQIQKEFEQLDRYGLNVIIQKGFGLVIR